VVQTAWNGQNVRQFNAYAVNVSVLKETEPSDALLKPPEFSMLSTNHVQEFNSALYSLRREVVSFFTINCPNLLMLGGRGWDDVKVKFTGIADKQIVS
jgi:hypothetical protein